MYALLLANCGAKLLQMFRCSKHINYLYTSFQVSYLYARGEWASVSFFTKNRGIFLNKKGMGCCIFAAFL